MKRLSEKSGRLGQPPDHDLNHGGSGPHFRGLAQPFKILAQAARAIQPAQRPFDSPTHGGTVKLLSNLLKEAVGSAAILSVQDPIELNQYSEPQPDIATLRPRADYYRDAHPRPDDVLLVIEVSDNTLRYDRDVKLPLYAKAGIPEAWLVDLKARVLSVSREPRASGFKDTVVADDLTKVALPNMPKQTIDLSALFGGS